MDERHRILIVDDEEMICELLEAGLSHCFEVMTATNAQQAIELCETEQCDLVVADINMPDCSGLDLLASIHTRWPHMILVLMTGYDVNAYLAHAREHGIATIIAKTAPINFREIESELSGLLSGAIFGLERYLLPDGRILARYVVQSSEDARSVRRRISELFMQRFGNVRDVELVVDEVVSNALYHAPAKPDGTPKYEGGSIVHLEEGEYVQIECGCDSEKYGVSVTDNSGRLSKTTVLDRIERQISGKGLTDLRGRGIHLSRMLSDRMFVNIKRGERTQVILLNYFRTKYRGSKPLYINEI
jgi:DNA-binding response OmpR family regulator